MRILFAFIILFCTVSNMLHAQQTQLDFVPASKGYHPFINSYSASGDIKQFYLQNAKWEKNASIPSFTDGDKFRNVGLQYIKGNDKTPPQLFAYSQATGDFAFYFLYKNKWVVNQNIPSGNISLRSSKITAEYSPMTKDMSSYIFAYSSDGKNIVVLEMKDKSWKQIQSIPNKLPQN